MRGRALRGGGTGTDVNVRAAGRHLRLSYSAVEAGSPPHLFDARRDLRARRQPSLPRVPGTYAGCMAESADGYPGGRLRRLRWRLSGAWLWPAFVVVTLLEMALLHWLPIAGDGSGWVAVAAAGGQPQRHRDRGARRARRGGAAPPAAAICPRSWPTTTRASRRSPSSGWPSSSPGSCTAPSSPPSTGRSREQSLAVRLWVDANANDFARAHVDGADTRAGRPRPVPHLRAAARSEALAVPDRRHVARAAARQARHEPRIQCIAESARGLQVDARECR